MDNKYYSINTSYFFSWHKLNPKKVKVDILSIVWNKYLSKIFLIANVLKFWVVYDFVMV